MNKIMSFVGLDLRLLKPYAKSVLVLVFLGIMMGVIFKSGEMLTSYFMVTLILMMSYPFAISEKNNLDILYGALPMDKKTVVFGRYGFVLLSAFAGAVFSFIGYTIITLAFGQTLSFASSAFSLCLSAAIFLFITSLQYPIYFKFGYTKGKAASYIPLLIITAAVLIVPMLSKWFNFNISFTSLLENFMGNPAVSCMALLLFGLLSISVSCYISYRLYSKKDI